VEANKGPEIYQSLETTFEKILKFIHLIAYQNVA
jgi:hypothetical protein